MFPCLSLPSENMLNSLSKLRVLKTWLSDNFISQLHNLLARSENVFSLAFYLGLFCSRVYWDTIQPVASPSRRTLFLETPEGRQLGFSHRCRETPVCHVPTPDSSIHSCHQPPPAQSFLSRLKVTIIIQECLGFLYPTRSLFISFSPLHTVLVSILTCLLIPPAKTSNTRICSSKESMKQKVLVRILKKVVLCWELWTSQILNFW